jgi:shikimate kinase
MVIALIGESCVGKSTIADRIKSEKNAAVYTGKDYLKLSKNEADARKAFAQLLLEAQDAPEVIVCVISENEQLVLLPQRAVRVLVTADLQTIKDRFAKRTGGTLPPPVEAMLERKHGMFDRIACDYHFVNGQDDTDEIIKIISVI